MKDDKRACPTTEQPGHDRTVRNAPDGAMTPSGHHDCLGPVLLGHRHEGGCRLSAADLELPIEVG
jgi:hypothetical protein